MRVPTRPILTVLAWPLALAVLQLAGLVIGLTGKGWRDALSAALVGASIIIFAGRWRLRAGRPHARKP